MKALLSFAILITIFGESFFTDGSPQFEKLDDILKKLPVSLIDLAKKPIEETDSSSDCIEKRPFCCNCRIEGGCCTNAEGTGRDKKICSLPKCKGIEGRRCKVIEVVLTGNASKTHGGQNGKQESPFGPLQGKYYRAPDVCGKPSWFKQSYIINFGFKKTYYNGVYYENQRIWWHGGEDCGKKVSKGFSGYWKIGTFWDDSFSLGAMDTLDANPSVEGPPWDYDHRRNVWSYWDWKYESPKLGWVGPTREIKVNCVVFEGDNPFPYEGEQNMGLL